MRRLLIVFVPLLVAPLIALSVMAWLLAGRAETHLLTARRERHQGLIGQFERRFDGRLGNLARQFGQWGTEAGEGTDSAPPDRGQRWSLVFDVEHRWWHPGVYAARLATDTEDGQETPTESAWLELTEVQREEQSSPSMDLVAQGYEALVDRSSVPDPVRAEALLGLARCRQRLGQTEGAIECYVRLMDGFRSTLDETGMNFGAEAADAYVKLAISTGDGGAALKAWRRYADDLLGDRYPMLAALAASHIADALALAPQSSNEADGERGRRLRERGQHLAEMTDAVTAIIGHSGYGSARLDVRGELVVLSQPVPLPTGRGWSAAAFTVDWAREILVGPLVDELNALAVGRVAIHNAFGEPVLGEHFDPEARSGTLALSRWGLPWTLEVGFSDMSSLRAEARRRHVLLSGSIAVLVILVALGVVLGWRMVHREMELSKLKSDFVDNVSHELRTPVTSIRLFSEMLQGGRITDPDRKQEYFRLLDSESRRLARMVENMLNFSRIVAGRMRLKPVATDMSAYLTELHRQLEVQARSTGHRVHLHLGRDLPTCRIDRDAMSRAIANLISNAAKFSPEVRDITLTAQRRDGMVSLMVRDRGLGIPPEELPYVFDRFYRARHTDGEHVQGTGLGLTIVKDTVERHGGTVSIQSQPGEGTVVELLIRIDSGSNTS